MTGWSGAHLPRPPARRCSTLWSAPEQGVERPRAALTCGAGWGRVATQGRPGAPASGWAVVKGWGEGEATSAAAPPRGRTDGGGHARSGVSELPREQQTLKQGG